MFGAGPEADEETAIRFRHHGAYELPWSPTPAPGPRAGTLNPEIEEEEEALTPAENQGHEPHHHEHAIYTRSGCRRGRPTGTNKLFASDFEGSTVHTLTVDGRPAWIAREISAILGYSHAGKRLASKITADSSEDFVVGRDFSLLVGSALLAVKAECDAVPSSTRGLFLMLFESGLHLALIRTHMPLGRRLRRFLVDEVLPQLVRTGASEPEKVSPASTGDLELAARALRVDFEDRRFRSRALRHTADALSELGRIDEGLWACLVQACEIALGRSLPLLHGAIDHDWFDARALARQLRVPLQRIFDAATALSLFQRSEYVRPLPTREGPGWTLTFRLSPEAVALVEAWLAEQDDLAVTASTPAA